MSHSGIAGRNTSKVEVLNISAHGFWIFLNEREWFLPYEDFPEFKNATVADILNVNSEHGQYLFWPSLNIDLELDSIEHPEKYPLKYREFKFRPVVVEI